MTFLLLLLALLLSFADQSLLSPLLNPLLRDFFGGTSSVVPLGWVSFALTLAMAVSTVASGILSDRGSRKKLVLAGCLLFSLVSALTPLIPHGRAGYALFFAGRALGGLGLGAILPAVFSMVGDAVAAARRGAAFGLVSMSMLVGRMAGFLTAGALAHTWRTAYALVGAAGLLLALALAFAREPRRGAQEEELRDALQAGADYRFRIRRKDFRTLRSVGSNIWLILNFVDVVPGAILVFLIFKFMKDDHNMEAGPVNFIVLLVMIFGALGALLFGRLGDVLFRRDKRARVALALACNALPIVFLVFFITADFRLPEGASLGQALQVPGVWVVLVSVVGAMFVNQGVNPNWYGTLTDVNLPEHRATMVSLASVMDMLGNALGPILASYIALLWDLRAALWAALIIWGLNIVLWLPVLHHVRRDLERRHRLLASRAAEMGTK
ncbi:MAG: MFS transporter [Candidatus Aminicenantes bacterium]|nr:MFS transporter [Candidatus Aminicenantes bacterium]